MNGRGLSEDIVTAGAAAAADEDCCSLARHASHWQRQDDVRRLQMHEEERVCRKKDDVKCFGYKRL